MLMSRNIVSKEGNFITMDLRRFRTANRSRNLGNVHLVGTAGRGISLRACIFGWTHFVKFAETLGVI